MHKPQNYGQRGNKEYILYDSIYTNCTKGRLASQQFPRDSRGWGELVANGISTKKLWGKLWGVMEMFIILTWW